MRLQYRPTNIPVNDCYFRRVTTAFFLIMLSLCCLTLAFIPKSHSTAILLVYLSGKCVVGACFQLVWLITSEIYPTNLRAQALGTCSTVARVFGLACPFVANLAMLWKPLPMLTLGLPAMVAGILAFLVLPETSAQSLPQNMEEAANLNLAEKKKKTPEKP